MSYIPKLELDNMYIGFHGSPKKFEQFQHCTYNSNYGNSGLGVFVAKDIKGAIPYSYNYEENQEGYVYVVAFSKEKILEVEHELFFCFNEPASDIDPMGYEVDLGGTATREQYLLQGYSGFKLANLENCGEAFAIFNPERIIILDVLTTQQALEQCVDKITTKVAFKI